MKTYFVINGKDGNNDGFSVQAETEEEAAMLALKEMGWFLMHARSIEESNENQSEI